MTEPMKAKDMLDMRHDLQIRLLNRNVRDAMADLISMGSSGTVPDNEAWNIVDATLLTIERAENFFVNADMCEMIAHAATAFDETDKADTTLPPVDNGFVYFESPMVLRDIRGSEIKVNAMLWRRTPMRQGRNLVDGFMCHMWNDQERTPDSIAMLRSSGEVTDMFGHKIDQGAMDKFDRENGRWGYIGITSYIDGQDIGPEQIEASEEIAEAYHNNGVAAVVPYTNVSRFFHAFWLMMQQPLAEAVLAEKPDRATKRRMAAANLPSDVTIIQFRRRESSKSEGPAKKVDWSHRWLVRGHWRWQWYKDEHKVSFQRRIWIPPCIKGPDDKDFIPKQKINVLVR